MVHAPTHYNSPDLSSIETLTKQICESNPLLTLHCCLPRYIDSYKHEGYTVLSPFEIEIRASKTFILRLATGWVAFGPTEGEVCLVARTDGELSRVLTRKLATGERLDEGFMGDWESGDEFKSGSFGRTMS